MINRSDVCRIAIQAVVAANKEAGSWLQTTLMSVCKEEIIIYADEQAFIEALGLPLERYEFFPRCPVLISEFFCLLNIF